MTIPVSDVAAPALAVRPSSAPGRLRQSLALYLPAGLLALIIAACFLWPLVGSVPPPVGGSVLDASLPVGTPGHLLGTDAAGNDIFSRLLYGGRVSLEVGAATQVIGIVVGGLIGMIAGYSRGFLAAALMRVYRSEVTGGPVSRAGWPYAAFWTVVVAARAAFSWGAAHWFTAPLVAWCIASQVSQAAITDGLIFMAIVMVLVRTGGLRLRASRLPDGALEPQGA